MANERNEYPELQLVVVEMDEKKKQKDNLNDLITEYEILNDKCEKALKRIYERRGGN